MNKQKIWRLIFGTLMVFMLISCSTQSNSDDSSTLPAGKSQVAFLLTDAPRDELSLLQVELTRLSIVNTLGEETVVFAPDTGDPFVLNLLDLDSLNQLLSLTLLPEGLYKELRLEYINAKALDTEGNPLTVRDHPYGTARALLNPYIQLFNDETSLEIDFDLNNSVFEIVSGPKGHILLSPTLIVRVISGNNEDDHSDIAGTVVSVEPMALDVEVTDRQVRVVLTSDTVVEAGDIVLTPGMISEFALTDYISTGDKVDVRGVFDTETHVLTASKVERKFPDTVQATGVVLELTAASFTFRVLGSGSTSFTPGEVRTIAIVPETFFLYIDPFQAATAKSLSPGQRVRVYLNASAPDTAVKVKLEETGLCGTVLSLNPAANRLTLQAKRSSGLDISGIPGFVNPVSAEFPDGLPSEAGVNMQAELEGHYNRLNTGVFAVNRTDFADGNGEDLKEDGEPAWVGKVYTLTSRSPLTFTLTRGAAEDPTGHRTVTVTATSDTALLLKNGGITEQITSGTLADGIQSGTYHLIKARGTYNPADRTLQATMILAMRKS